MSNKTVSFNEEVKGWTSFYTFAPDLILGMNSQLFSFHGGNLYVHHSDLVPRNTFYGEQSPSKASVMINDSPSDVKLIKTISLEGNYSWDAMLTAFVSNVDNNIKSSVTSAEFVQKEGIWYAYVRGNEDPTQVDSKAAYGIGEILQKLPNNTLKVKGGSSVLVQGDVIIRGSDMSVVGEVLSSSVENGITTLSLSSLGATVVGDFIFGTKNPRVEGGSLRGYTIKIDLSINKNDKVELFAVNAGVIQSAP